MSQPAPADWYPDPFGRYEHRYWDGVQWTHHVGSDGRQQVDPPVPAAPTAPSGPQAPADIGRAGRAARRQAESFGITDSTQSGASLFSESVLVVNQKAKLFEMKAEYGVFDRMGQRVGSVREVGHSLTKLAMGSNGTRRLQVVDSEGRVAMTLIRPAKVLKSKVIVMGADGSQIGQIAQDNLGIMASTFGGRFNIRFRLESGGQVLGTINAESWRAWDFNIQDSSGSEVARITKTWAGIAKEWFTKADNYVVEIHGPMTEPLRSLVVAAALAIDTALKQEDDQSRRRSR